MGSFPYIKWKFFEAIIISSQTFCVEEQKTACIGGWHRQCMDFQVTVKNGLTHWKKKEKYKTSLSNHTIEKLEEAVKISNKYYHLRQKGVDREESK